MISKELSEASVELNAILDNTSIELVNKIPKKFLQFMKENASITYKFEYDKTKTLEEQNIKPKTKGLIALIYKDYLCNESEKQQYLNNIEKILNNIEIEKREKYNPDNVFKNIKKEQRNLNTDEVIGPNLPIQIKKDNIFTKIISFIKKLFRKS